MAGANTSLSGLAGRYALALLDLADEEKSLDSVADDLRALRQMIGESEDFRRVLSSPMFSREQQAAAVLAIAEKAGLGETTRRFTQVLARNRRLFALPQIIDAYLSELAHRRGEVTAHVTSAVELSSAQRQALVESLKASVGGKVQVDVKVDDSLIGGLIVKVGSRMIDNSLRSKLQRLQLAMKGIG
ncbi:MAG: F0F1 ATP synthase subunit delta [Alphaproteobacteria bacterium]